MNDQKYSDAPPSYTEQPAVNMEKQVVAVDALLQLPSVNVYELRDGKQVQIHRFSPLNVYRLQILDPSSEVPEDLKYLVL
jgi:hypothetical protein